MVSGCRQPGRSVDLGTRMDPSSVGDDAGIASIAGLVIPVVFFLRLAR
jgi:hypothetical protein